MLKLCINKIFWFSFTLSIVFVYTYEYMKTFPVHCFVVFFPYTFSLSYDGTAVYHFFSTIVVAVVVKSRIFCLIWWCLTITAHKFLRWNLYYIHIHIMEKSNCCYWFFVTIFCNITFILFLKILIYCLCFYGIAIWFSSYFVTSCYIEKC